MNKVFLWASSRSVLALVALCIFLPVFATGQQSQTRTETRVGFNETASLTVKPPGQRRHVTFTPRAVSFDPSTESTGNPTPASSYNWTGFYIGGHAGYNWGKADTSFDPLPDAATFINLAPTTLKPDPKGFTGGVQGGYNWQIHHFVIGGEVDLTWTDVDGTARLTPIPQNNGTPFPGAGFLVASQKTSWTNTYRARGGVTLSRVLLYGTIGLALGRVRYTADSDFRPVGTEHYPADFARTRSGLVGGGGGEVGIARHFSVKAEYLFYDLRRVQTTVNAVPPLPPFQVQYGWKTQANTFNAGVNFHF